MAADRSRPSTAEPSSGLVRTGLHVATRTLQLVLAGIALVTVLMAEWGLLVNTLVMLGIAVVPDALRYRYDVRPLPVVGFLVAAAPFLHAVGAMGPYRSVPAFDQVAHSVSAVLVAGFGYVIVRLIESEYDDVTVPPNLRFAFVLIFATSFGVAWEVLEFGTGLLSTVTGGEQLLEQYGPRDVVLDLLFNTIGALVVALWGTSYFDTLSRTLASWLDVGY